MDLHVLSWIVFLPAAAGLLLALVPGERSGLVRGVALASALGVLGLSVYVYVQCDGTMRIYDSCEWIPTFKIRYRLGVDGLGAAMVLLTAFLMPLAIGASWRQSKGFQIALLFLETGMMGAFVALDLFLFYVFWEAMLLPMYLLIGVWGGPRRIYAAVKFIVYTLVGSLLMLAAVLYCYAKVGSFDVLSLQRELPRLAGTEQMWLYLAFAFSFAIKVPMFPFHTWLPDAHVEAPTAGSVILAGVLLKMGAYGFLRFAIPFFPWAARHYTPLTIALAVVGIVYGAAMAMAQSDLKKLVAYSSVSHLGFVMLGIFSGTLSGAQGGVLQMVNHGLSTGALFLLVGIIYEKTHRRGIDDFGGMARVTPVYAALFMIVTLSSIGLPGLNGFVGEFLVLFGAFQKYPAAAAVSASAVILGAVYMLNLYRSVFFGPVTLAEREKTPDVGRFELAYLVPIVALLFILGVYPSLVLRKTEPSVAPLVELLGPQDHVSAQHRSR
jgi:NADH-quinone oxidoreductase subunit M